MVSTVFIVPLYFGFKVENLSDSRNGASGVWNFSFVDLNDVGETNYFKIYLLFLALLENVVGMASLSIVNLISLTKFRRIMSKKKRVTAQKRKIDGANMRLAKLIILLSFNQIFVRFFDAFSSVFLELKLLNEENIPMSDCLIIFLKRLSQFLMIAIHSLDGVLYFAYDNQLKKAFCGAFGKKFT